MIVTILIAAVFFYFSIFKSPSSSINENGWQAVFLENDQVYFGKLTLTSNFYVLRKVYYLQTEEKDNDQLGNLATKSVDVEINKNKDITRKLIKLGNELHGPEDAMFIEKSKVLFWENMKNISTIVQSIEDFEQKSANVIKVN